ncbi:hypothetical protein EUTSA_v10028288mg [Eutrema salsugineum]|uniref:MATH domain-containing protein n=1 Tax=Eutrema salsugineum TaxID=72664 RepID=V4M3T4_EUTSA|nr:hypothetical protein EUTSA_v10028288mg [Eutrema salsugineum]
MPKTKSRLCGKVDVLEVIGEFYVSDEAENSAQPLKNLKLNASSDLLINKKKQLNESVDVEWVQIFHHRRIFEKYLDVSKFRFKYRHLKSTYMNVVLGLIETLCQSPQEVSDDDLDETFVAVSYVAKGGLKVEEVKEKKKKVANGKARLQQMEDALKQKCLDLKALVDKEKKIFLWPMLLSRSNSMMLFDLLVFSETYSMIVLGVVGVLVEYETDGD